MVVVDTEMKPTKDGQGQYLQINMQVADGEHANRKITDRLNLVNKNATAQNIAYASLKEICQALGLETIDDSAVMHGKRMKVTLKVQPGQGEYGPQNAVAKYSALASSAPASAPADAPAWEQ